MVGSPWWLRYGSSIRPAGRLRPTATSRRGSPPPRLAARARRASAAPASPHSTSADRGRIVGGGPGPRAPSRQAPRASDGLGLLLDVREEGPIIGAFQSLLDEGAQHDLEAHGEPELRRRPTGQDSGPLEDVRREN